MSEESPDLSPTEQSLQYDMNIAHKALRRVIGFAAVALAGAALFVTHEAQIGWNFNPNDLDASQASDTLLAGMAIGYSIGSYSLYADARNRIRYRQEMISRKNNDDDD
jgi:hypothetical protein